MNTTVITAIITALSTLIVCLINNFFQNRTNEAKHYETIKLIEYKLEELTKRVEKHNNVIERTYKLEEIASIYDEKIKVINHRIDDLEKKEG